METILLLEPNKNTAEELKTKLSLEGYNVIISESVSDGNKIISEENISIVISEFNLKDTDISKLLNKKKDGTIIPIILITSQSRTSKFEATCKTYNINWILYKPFSFQNLLKKVDWILNRENEYKNKNKEENIKLIIPESGDLSDFPFPLLLYQISLEKKDTELTLSQRNSFRRLIFEGGNLKKILYNFAKGDNIGIYFCNNKKITELDYFSAYEILVKNLGKIDSGENIDTLQDYNKKLGEILISMGLITENELLDALKKEAESRITSLFIWNYGRYQFSKGLKEKNIKNSLGLNIISLTLSAIEKYGNLVDMRRRYKLLEKFFIVPQPNYLEIFESLNLSLLEMKFVLIISQDKTLKSAIEESSISLSRAYQLLSLLEIFGKISFISNDTKKLHISNTPYEGVLTPFISNFPKFKKGGREEKIEEEEIFIEETKKEDKLNELPNERDDNYKKSLPPMYEEVITKIDKYLFSEEMERSSSIVTSPYGLIKRPQLAQLHFERGEIAFSSGDIKGAVESYKKAIFYCKDTPNYYLKLGIALFNLSLTLKNKDFQEAKEYLERAKSLDNKIKEANFYLGLIAKEEGNFYEAKSFLLAELVLDPENINILNELKEVESKILLLSKKEEVKEDIPKKLFVPSSIKADKDKSWYIGPYKIVDKAGEGGMGDIYKGYDANLDRFVAVKVISERLKNDKVFLERFQKEAKALAKLNSPYITQIYYIDIEAERPFFAMEFVDGVTIRELIDKYQTIPVPHTLDIAIQTCKGLIQAKNYGIIHRDINPKNIMITKDGKVKIMDFGLVKSASKDKKFDITISGVVLGTPLYMSPEQTQGIEIDYRSDIYSLGITLYHMLVGDPPFFSKDLFKLLEMHEKATLPVEDKRDKSIPSPLCDILLKMTEKKPQNRYQDYQPLINDLTKIMESYLSPKDKNDFTLSDSFLY